MVITSGFGPEHGGSIPSRSTLNGMEKKAVIRSMWTDEQIVEFARLKIDGCAVLTPSAITMKSHYAGNDNKFTHTRAIVEKAKQTHK